MTDGPHVLCLRVESVDADAVTTWFEPLAASLGLDGFRAYEDEEEPAGVELYVDVDRRATAEAVTAPIVEASRRRDAAGRAVYVAVFRRACA